MHTSNVRRGIRGANWSSEDSADLYQVSAWGQGYFDVSADGHVVVRPHATDDAEIDLLEVVHGLRERDLSAPLLIRFSEILAHRLRCLRDAFQTAIDENEYEGRYVAVYPIKVNQQRPVVEEVYRFGTDFDFGLEVGSKPELLAVMALTEDAPDRLIVCNGFKDDSYIEAVILSTKLGRNIIPVVENFGELRLLLKHAARYEVMPKIGVRVKLASQGAGRWRDSAGEKSKFGLFVSEVLEMVELLTAHGMLDSLKLVHCHTGSQIQDIRRLKEAVGELSHIYAELVRLGVEIEYVDVGGGLGVDYDGSQTNYPSSMNYTVQEYANEVVYRIASICNERDVAHPTIISESGRAMAAYQSVLVVNVLGAAGPRTTYSVDVEVVDDEDLPQPVRDLIFAYESVHERTLVEAYHDAVQAREQALNLFNLGYLSLELRGLAERLFWATCARVADAASRLDSMPEELAPLEDILSETYFCNFSLFQSLPDSWAIGQLFPVMPIHRLDEEPTRRAVLADMTCDSDGKIDRFVDVRDVKKSLELHDLHAGEDYYLAVFLVGAYQETLGDLHNLFGDTHVVHVGLHEEGGWTIEEFVEGDTAREVLGYMQYRVDGLYPRLVRDCESAVRSGRMTLPETRTLLRFYQSALEGYTYLESLE
ncbi:MAG: biosynthetic arginine decarboxylase [marine benthic group bacterium]|nr:biosynthetic arginine decarboxylase [Gemmatimonadota bacterium]